MAGGSQIVILCWKVVNKPWRKNGWAHVILMDLSGIWKGGVRFIEAIFIDGDLWWPKVAAPWAQELATMEVRGSVGEWMMLSTWRTTIPKLRPKKNCWKAGTKHLGPIPIPILVGGLEDDSYFPFHIWDVILPIDELHHIFQMVGLHHQPDHFFPIEQLSDDPSFVLRTLRLQGHCSHQLIPWVKHTR
jgi:hypothetical protein